MPEREFLIYLDPETRLCRYRHYHVSKGKEIDEASARLNSIRKVLENKGANITVHVLEGDPAKEILDLAKKQDSTLIIMSSQGKGWMKQIRVGSTTFDVARRALIPVMVVKQSKS